MKKFRVNRDKGWPLDAPRFDFGVEFESDEQSAAAAVESGYLIALDEPEPEPVEHEYYEE